MTKAANKLGQSLRPSDEAELGKVRLKLLNAGFRNENAVAIFYGAKAILLLLGLAIALSALGSASTGMTQTTPSPTIALAGGLGFYLPGFVVGQPQEEARRSRSSWGCPTPWT